MQLHYLVHKESSIHSFLWQTVNWYASTMKHFCDLDLWTLDLENLIISTPGYLGNFLVEIHSAVQKRSSWQDFYSCCGLTFDPMILKTVSECPLTKVHLCHVSLKSLTKFTDIASCEISTNERTMDNRKLSNIPQPENCIWACYGLELWSLTLRRFDLWPCKPFQWWPFT